MRRWTASQPTTDWAISPPPSPPRVGYLPPVNVRWLCTDLSLRRRLASAAIGLCAPLRWLQGGKESLQKAYKLMGWGKIRNEQNWNLRKSPSNVVQHTMGCTREAKDTKTKTNKQTNKKRRSRNTWRRPTKAEGQQMGLSWGTDTDIIPWQMEIAGPCWWPELQQM